jgi:hypothetical protein
MAQVIKKYKGEKAAQRGIAEMERMGYEVDQMNTRKAMYSAATGVFTRKQIHTVVFKKTGSADVAQIVDSRTLARFRAAKSGSMTHNALGAGILTHATGRSAKEISEVAKSRDISAGRLAEMYLAGEVAEFGVPDLGDEALANTSSPAPPEPTQPVGSVADELAKLAALRDAGVLSGDEFDAQKAKLLAG